MSVWWDSAKLVLKSGNRNAEIEEQRTEFMQNIANSFDREQRESVLLYLDEMVDRFDAEFYAESTALIEELFLKRFFENIHLENAPTQGDGALVFLSNHRSMFDFLVQGVKFEENGISPPRYAAGKNLFKGVLGDIFRKWGAVAMDREQKSPLYIQTELAIFTQYLLDGANLLIYPEAGRSYTGSFKKLKRGMLQSVINAHEKNPGLKYKIVTATISYDRVAEDVQLVSSEERKQMRGGVIRKGLKDQFLDAARVAPVYWAKCGNAYLTFGEPFCLEELEGNNKRGALIEKIDSDFKSMYKITRADVAAYCMGCSRSWEPRGAYERRVSETVQRLKSEGRNIESGLENLTVDELLEDRHVNRIIITSGIGVMPKNPGLVKYYANAVRDVLNES